MKKYRVKSKVSGKTVKSKFKELVVTGAVTSILLVGSAVHVTSASAGSTEAVTASLENEEMPISLGEEAVGEFTAKTLEIESRGVPVASYNPTEPELQLGDIIDVRVDESGAVGLDESTVQGSLDVVGEVTLEGVKGKGVLYYVLEKDGDVISVHVNDSKIVGEDGSTVKVVDVDSVDGNNGTADKDGFKSNLIPEDVLPKTGDIPTDAKTMGLLATFLGLMGITLGVRQREKSSRE